MSRLSRLKEYANPMKGPHGAASSPENLAYWSERASANSQIPPRAKGPVLGGPQGTYGKDPPSLPSTGKSMAVRPTEAKPREPRKVNARMAGKDDLNHEGSDYFKSIRREA
jgi:hypothetical protein